MPRASVTRLSGVARNLAKDGAAVVCTTPLTIGNQGKKRPCGRKLTVNGKIRCSRPTCKHQHSLVGVLATHLGIDLDALEEAERSLLTAVWVRRAKAAALSLWDDYRDVKAIPKKLPKMPKALFRLMPLARDLGLYPVCLPSLGRWVLVGNLSDKKYDQSFPTSALNSYSQGREFMWSTLRDWSADIRRLARMNVRCRLPVSATEVGDFQAAISTFMYGGTRFFATRFEWVGNAAEKADERRLEIIGGSEFQASHSEINVRLVVEFPDK